MIKKTYKSKAKRQVTFRKKPLTVKTVKQIAKQVTLKTSETKSYIAGNYLNPLDNGWQVQNLIYPIAQGSGAENVIGEKIHISNIRINGMLTIATTGARSKMCRLVVFKTKKALTNSSGALSSTDLVRPAGGYSYVPTQHIDLHKVDLLVDRRMTLHPNTNDQTAAHQFVINLKLDKDEWFDQDNSGYLKNKNYYLAFGCYDASSSITAPVNCTYQWSVNFKDN